MSANPDNHGSLFKRLSRYTLRARRLLVWERYGPVLAPGLLALALFSAAAVSGLWERLGDPWRIIALIATIFFVARSIYRALPLRFPTKSDAQRRVESDSGQAHRPLDVLADQPALSIEAWPAHYTQALIQAKHMTRPKSQAVLSKIDPYYLRIAAPLFLVAAMVIGAGFGFERIKRAATPSWQAGISPSDVSFEAWIDPPAYTGRPPIYFKEGTNIIVPTGSEFVARISGASNPPRPKLFQGLRSRFIPLTRLGAQSLEARTTIDSAATAEWRIGLHRETWQLNVKKDTPPNVDFLDLPEADKRDRLIFSYYLDDDYGVENLRLEMAVIEDDLESSALFEGPTQFTDVPLSSGSVKKAENNGAALDMTKHIWAGRKVIGRLVARDGAGHVALSKTAYFTVPDKIFVEPLAKAVVEHRQLVLAGQGRDYARRPNRTDAMGIYNLYEPELRMDRAPASIERAALLIDAVTDSPDAMFKDPAVFLGLRNVSSRLRYADESDDLLGIPEDLWKIAIRAEFGVLGTALEEMREAEAALRDGIARRAAKREVDTLFDRYNTAVENYTEELRRQALEDGNFAEGGGGGGGEGMQSVDEIEELLKAIEEANAAGDTEGARRALAKLAKLLENMEIQLSQGGGGGEGGEPMEGEMTEEMKKSLEELADMMGEQRELQDETRQAERSINEEDESLSPQELAERQAELENLLDKLSGALPSDLAEARPGGQKGEDGEGAAPGEGEQDGQSGTEPGGDENAAGGGEEAGEQPGGEGTAQGENGEGSGGQSVGELLENARRAMGRSGSGLQSGELGDARRAQDEVLSELREAGKLLAEAASEGKEGGEDGEGDDPLGRSEDGFDDGSSEADIELRDNATRSRELLEELRRRAAEQDRQKEEREYLERLLKRF